MMPIAVDVLTVTYGNRWPVLRDMLLSLPAVRRIVIIDNGCTYNLPEQLITLQLPPIQYIQMPENTGSAWAFATGMEFLSRDADVNCIWLLDDDLIIQPDCLNYLLQAWQELKQQHPPDELFLQCMRPDRSYMQYAAKGQHVELFFPMEDHFLGFHVGKLSLKRKRKKIISQIKALPDKASVRIPCAPYGGLFLHRSAVTKFGTPDKRFHTYADDFDYTLRCTKQGAGIYLIPKAIAEDRLPTLVNTRSHGVLSSKFFDMPYRRLFLLMRNTTYYTEHQLVQNTMQYTLNKWIYSAYLLVSALLNRKLRSFKIFTFAVRKGSAGEFSDADIPT